MKLLLQFNLLAVIGIALLSSPACTEKRDLTNNVVIQHIISEPDNLHPINGNSATRTFIYQYTQKRVLRPDLKTLETVPELVKSLPEISDDKLHYKYELIDGVKWDDGESLSVEDVIFTVKMQKCPLADNAGKRSYYSQIENVIQDSIDPLKFSMECNDLYFDNPNVWTTDLFILQKSWFDPEGIMDRFEISDFNDPGFNPDDYPELQEFFKKVNSGEYGRKPEKLNGLGPYFVKEWNTGNSIILERKENWWGEGDTSVYNQNYPKRIIFKVIRDGASVSLSLKKEEIDVTTGIGTNELIKLRERDYFNENYESGFIDQYGYLYLGMNMKPDGVDHKPYFTDNRVRRAMAHLVPTDEIIEVIVNGKALRQTSLVSPLKPSYNDTLEPLHYDVEKAKDLLDRSGWIDSDGDNIRDKNINGQKVDFNFNLSYMSNPVTKEIVLMIKDGMYQAGIDVIPTPMDFAVFYRNAQNHKFDMMLGAWSSPSGPNDPEQLWHTENWANKGFNFTGFGDAESDSLIELANRTLDIKTREDIMRQLQAKVYKEQPYVFMYSVKRKIAIHRRFENRGMYSERPGVILNNLNLKESYRQSAKMHQPEARIN